MLSRKQIMYILIGCIASLLAAVLIWYFMGKKATPGKTSSKTSSCCGDKEVTMYHADWCGHCKKMLPEFKELSGVYGKDINFTTIESAEADKMKAAGIRAFPTMVLYQNGQEIRRQEGATDKDGIKKFLG